MRGYVISLFAAAWVAAFMLPSASASAGGSIEFWATPTTAGSTNLVIAGAIGDYGKSLNIDQSGKADPKGKYALVTLQKGTFRINLTAFTAATNKASFPIDKASCSSEGAVTAPATASSGTGLYKGISGKVSITATYVWILSRDSGKCNGNKVLLQSAYLTGTGTVSFS